MIGILDLANVSLTNCSPPVSPRCLSFSSCAAASVLPYVARASTTSSSGTHHQTRSNATLFGASCFPPDQSNLNNICQEQPEEDEAGPTPVDGGDRIVMMPHTTSLSSVRRGKGDEVDGSLRSSSSATSGSPDNALSDEALSPLSPQAMLRCGSGSGSIVVVEEHPTATNNRCDDAITRLDANCLRQMKERYTLLAPRWDGRVPELGDFSGDLHDDEDDDSLSLDHHRQQYHHHAGAAGVDGDDEWASVVGEDDDGVSPLFGEGVAMLDFTDHQQQLCHHHHRRAFHRADSRGRLAHHQRNPAAATTVAEPSLLLGSHRNTDEETYNDDDGDWEEGVNDDDDLEVAGVTAEGELLYLHRDQRYRTRVMAAAAPSSSVAVVCAKPIPVAAAPLLCSPLVGSGLPAAEAAVVPPSLPQRSLGDTLDTTDRQQFEQECAWYASQQALLSQQHQRPLWRFNEAHVRHVQQLSLRARDRENDLYAPYVAAELEQWCTAHNVLAAEEHLMMLSDVQLELLR